MAQVAGEALLQRLHLGPHGAGIGDDGARPVEAPAPPSAVKPRKREVRCTSITPSVSSSCLMPAEKVGCGHAAGFGGAAEVAFTSER